MCARPSQQPAGSTPHGEHPTPVRVGTRTHPRGRNARLSATAWMPDEDMDYRKWILEGRRIGAIGRGSPWWVGDWLHYGTTRWGERYLEAVKITGYDSKSLRNLRYVSSRFALSLRRDNLTWSHHALLAAMEPDEQRHWLDRAVANRFSVEDLRIELRTAQRGGYAARARLDELQLDEHSEPACRPILVCPQCGYEAAMGDFEDHGKLLSADPGSPSIT
jgi:hypothetical protein